jgi:hypothetical protein
VDEPLHITMCVERRNAMCDEIQSILFCICLCIQRRINIHIRLHISLLHIGLQVLLQIGGGILIQVLLSI